MASLDPNERNSGAWVIFWLFLPLLLCLCSLAALVIGYYLGHANV